MIELLDIRVFSRLSELTSFSAVSRVLGMPKSSVSRSLARLEEHLGVALVIRSNRKLALTETGLLFAESARKILSEVDDAEEKVGQVRLTPRGLLRVSSPVTPGQFMIAPLIPAYLATYPEVQVSLALTSSRIAPLADGVDVVSSCWYRHPLICAGTAHPSRPLIWRPTSCSTLPTGPPSGRCVVATNSCTFPPADVFSPTIRAPFARSCSRDRGLLGCRTTCAGRTSPRGDWYM
jgi:DNA-binding transcriptional LysR family regulator